MYKKFYRPVRYANFFDQVTWKVYHTYAIAVGYLACIGVVFCFVASSSFGIGTNLWLAAWSDANVTTSTISLDERLGVYFALGITQGIFIFLATILNAYATVSASVKLHKAILHNLLRVPTSFYDVTPLGAIINRVGKVNWFLFRFCGTFSEFTVCSRFIGRGRDGQYSTWLRPPVDHGRLIRFIFDHTYYDQYADFRRRYFTNGCVLFHRSG